MSLCALELWAVAVEGPWQCQEVWSSQPQLKELCQSKGCFPDSISRHTLLCVRAEPAESSQFFPAEEHRPLLGLSGTAVTLRAGQSHLLEGWLMEWFREILLETEQVLSLSGCSPQEGNGFFLFSLNFTWVPLQPLPEVLSDFQQS